MLRATNAQGFYFSNDIKNIYKAGVKPRGLPRGCSFPPFFVVLIFNEVAKTRALRLQM